MKRRDLMDATSITTATRFKSTSGTGEEMREIHAVLKETLPFMIVVTEAIPDGKVERRVVQGEEFIFVNAAGWRKARDELGDSVSPDLEVYRLDGMASHKAAHLRMILEKGG